MTWQNLLPSSLGNPSYNKTTQEVPLNKRSRKQEPKPYEFSTLSEIRTAPYRHKKGRSNYTTGFYSPSKGGSASIITPPLSLSPLQTEAFRLIGKNEWVASLVS